MQTSMSFTDTRARRTDGETSREAAQHAATQKAASERRLIAEAITHAPMTAREVAAWTGLGYIEVQRRISETGGIVKTAERRDGCYVWRLL